MSSSPRVLCHIAVLLGTTALVSAATTMPVAAGNVNWTGATTPDWQVGSNWSGSAVPTTNDTVTIDTMTPNPTILESGTGATGSLYVGATGHGSLTLDTGVGLTSSASSSIGDQAGGVGVVTVRGSASWLLSGLAMLEVGKYGNGTLHISSGALVTATTVVIGSQAGSTGLVTIDGVNSELSVNNTLIVGSNSGGTLNLTNGGQALAGNSAVVGDAAGVTGTVTVDGAKSWFSANSITVGSSGTGTVTVSNGGTISAGSALDLGFATSGNGTVTVTGAGSTLQVGSGGTGSLIIGDLGAGTLNINSGATGTVSGTVTLGNAANSSGILNLSGSGSTLTVSKVSGNGGSIYAGYAGSGTINLSNAATLTADQIFVGSQSGSQGTFNVRSGATVTANTGLDIGGSAGSTGTVTVTGTGSTLTAGSGASTALTVGDSGTGTLNIQAGGNVIANGLGLVGSLSGSSGTINVDGAGSQLTVNNNFYDGSAGGSGTGMIVVSNGGVITVADNSYIGMAGNATLTVTGKGSRYVDNGNDVNIGGNGTATVNILNGGNLTANNNVTIGEGAGAATVNVDGVGSILQSAHLTIGDGNSGSTATLNVTNGGTVNSGYAVLGFGNSSVNGAASVSGAGSVWNVTSTVSGNSLVIGNYGTGSLAVSNGGAATAAGNVVIAQEAGSTGTLIIGSAPGHAATAPGSVTAPSIQFGAGTGEIDFNHTGAAYTFAVPVSGSGIIAQWAGHTILTGDSSGFTGRAFVDGGTLSVNGSLANATVYVDTGGTLGGNGTVGALAVHAGGILAPGNSIGTLTVAASASFASGSFYQVEVDGSGRSDRLVVGGATTISGGTVQALATPSVYFGANRYTILTSAGGVTGTFAGVTSSAAFLTPSLSYDHNDVYLTLTRNAAGFASVGATRNQTATGAAVDAAGFGNPLWNAVVTLTAAQARTAFDQVSGEIHASTRATLVEDSRFLRDAAIDRLRDAFRNAGAPGGPAMAYASTDLAPAAPDASFAVWGRAIGSWGRTSSDGNAAAVSHDTAGLVSGVDALISDFTRLGALAGYTRTNLDSAATASTAGSDNFHVGVYSGSQWGALGLRAGATYSFNRIDATRSVAFPGFADHLTSAYDAGTFQAFGDLGYRIDVAPKAAVEPFAGIAYVGLHTNGFAESGGAAALTGSGVNTDVTFSTLGMRSAVGFDLGGMAATWKGSLGWRHAFGDVTPLATLAFAGGNPFTVAGAPIARDAAAIDAGFDVVVMRGVTFGISYSGQLAHGFQDNGVRADLDWKF
ncbi:MAG: autotransporter domain-containing protein [Xanthobacteraceae bacterium]|nr:autotransporter domain-containing protein [Xanthobacteraceae bacterium]